MFHIQKHRPGQVVANTWRPERVYFLVISLFFWRRYTSKKLIYTTKASHTPNLVSLMYVTPNPRQSGYVNGRERCGCRSPLNFVGTPLQSCFPVLPSSMTPYILFRGTTSSGLQTLKVKVPCVRIIHILLRALAPFGCKGTTFIWNTQGFWRFFNRQSKKRAKGIC